MFNLIKWFKNTIISIDWSVILVLLPILFFGLVTMYSFSEANTFFTRQIFWIVLSFSIFFILSGIDFKFLRKTQIVTWFYFIILGLLIGLFILGSTFQGAQSWLDFGFFSFQPSELAKLALILILAKYFSKRHMEIRNIRHIIVSGIYAFLVFFLVLLQPDFGSAIIVFLIWLSMVFVSGISKKHLFIVFSLGLISFIFLWGFVFADYQKNRIMIFLDPLQDVQGAGYNANQSMIAVGSGQWLGKGLGYGTQSRLKFLPEYQTDFIFAAYAEEWGFVGIIILFLLYFILIIKILNISTKGATNFEILYGTGLASMFVAHFVVHIGMNIGLLPVTGLTLAFMSYGGTNMLISFIGLGILMSMRRYSLVSGRDLKKNEFVGL